MLICCNVALIKLGACLERIEYAGVRVQLVLHECSTRVCYMSVQQNHRMKCSVSLQLKYACQGLDLPDVTRQTLLMKTGHVSTLHLLP